MNAIVMNILENVSRFKDYTRNETCTNDSYYI